jgi:hypothetical protein
MLLMYLFTSDSNVLIIFVNYYSFCISETDNVPVLTKPAADLSTPESEKVERDLSLPIIYQTHSLFPLCELQVIFHYVSKQVDIAVDRLTLLMHTRATEQ